MQYHSDLNHFVLNALRHFQGQELTVEFIEKGNPPVRLLSDVLKDLKAFILNENGVGSDPLVVDNVPYNPLTFYDNANEQVQLSKFWMDVMRAHRDENKLAATYQLRLQHEEAEEEQTVDVHGVYTQVSPTLHIYININVCEYVRVRICVCRSL